MGFLCLSAKSIKSLQFIYWSSVFKNSIPCRGLLGKAKSTDLEPDLSPSGLSTDCGCGKADAFLFHLSSLIHQMGEIADYGNVSIDIGGVRKCSVNSTALVLKK